MPVKKTMSARDKARWLGILAGVASMIVGAVYPVPLMFWEKRVTDNAFLLVGAVGMLLTFGVVQLVKAWRGGGA
ncbi:MAG: hypothetical protein IPJ01_12185 [Micavibrio sp.]|nr:hypothetical protein [Micavibrio sp.]